MDGIDLHIAHFWVALSAARGWSPRAFAMPVLKNPV
jgi:hypothetical protein